MISRAAGLVFPACRPAVPLWAAAIGRNGLGRRRAVLRHLARRAGRRASIRWKRCATSNELPPLSRARKYYCVIKSGSGAVLQVCGGSPDPHRRDFLDLTRTIKLVDFSRRRLPHRYAIGQPLFVTFRLHGSLPDGREFPPDSMTSGRAFVAMDRLLDAGRFGAVYLQRPEIARVARDSILHCAMADYDLHAWVIMPNHVHMLVTPLTNVPSFLRRLKGYSARREEALARRTNCWTGRGRRFGRMRATITWSSRHRNFAILKDTLSIILSMLVLSRSSKPFPGPARLVRNKEGRTWRSGADVDVCPTPAASAMLGVNV